jgi:hypothetical protein
LRAWPSTPAARDSPSTDAYYRRIVALAELILHGDYMTLDLRHLNYQRVIDNHPSRPVPAA